MAGPKPNVITSTDLHAALVGTGELALLDVREPKITAAEGALLLAVSVPAGRLELLVDRFVPRRSTPVVTFDSAGEGVATWAADRLVSLGYTDVRHLEGGVAEWGAAGFKVYAGGPQLQGQAFGEFIEERYATPHISVDEFRAKLEGGEDMVLLDSRPLAEFEVHTLPGSTSIPGAELVYRAERAVPSPDTLVVVHCAGRTRSILGAQVLINAGLPNEVVALEGGTQSWVLSGHEVEHGKRVEVPKPSPDGVRRAQEAAERISDRFGIRTLARHELQRFIEEATIRTLYLVDVRTPEEYERGHLPGSISAPSWDVAPWLFRHLATRHARIVLLDSPDLVRGTVSASWVTQMGWGEVSVASYTLTGSVETGPERQVVLGVPAGGVDLLEPSEIAARIGEGELLQVLDLSLSTAYRNGHVPSAWFALRSRLVNTVNHLEGDGAIVLCSEDGLLAQVAAPEIAAAARRPVWVLNGGMAAWREAGLAIETTSARYLHDPDDVAVTPWREENAERRIEGFRKYLSWEKALTEHLHEDDTVPFRAFALGERV
jgi:rhodanese-related sulfurtransferase